MFCHRWMSQCLPLVSSARSVFRFQSTWLLWDLSFLMHFKKSYFVVYLLLVIVNSKTVFFLTFYFLHGYRIPFWYFYSYVFKPHKMIFLYIVSVRKDLLTYLTFPLLFISSCYHPKLFSYSMKRTPFSVFFLLGLLVINCLLLFFFKKINELIIVI